MENSIKENGSLTIINELTKKDYNEFEIIMAIYKKALDNTIKECLDLKEMLGTTYNYDVITNITGRIKSPDSIASKMKKKNLAISYDNMIEHINDIAGVRIVCNYKDEAYKIRNIIRKQENIRVIKEKDYLKKPKKSGYSAYHMILEVPVTIKQEIIYIKVEIQIRTLLMDFWSTIEHKIKYKPKGKLSNSDSIKLSIYARIINDISDKMMKIHRKQTKLLR